MSNIDKEAGAWRYALRNHRIVVVDLPQGHWLKKMVDDYTEKEAKSLEETFNTDTEFGNQ